MHVLNEVGLKFYKSCGFLVDEKLENYYTDLEEPHCYILLKEIVRENQPK
jgi:ribosomal protein S18 acetylase RimI-like enzyme